MHVPSGPPPASPILSFPNKLKASAAWPGPALQVEGLCVACARAGGSCTQARTCHVALPQEEEAIVELSPRSFHLFPGAGCKFHLGPQIQALSRLVTCLDLTHFRPCLPARGPWQLLSDAA